MNLLNAQFDDVTYFDYQATTPCDPRVFEKMIPYFYEEFGNPHSRNHLYGWRAEAAVEKARKQVADIIGAEAKEIIFTSGATESNNLALQGIAQFYKGEKRHIITVMTEHKCVLDTCRHLEQEGFRVTYLPVQHDGLIDLGQLKSAIQQDTLLVSVMFVNNEIGVVQPISEIGKICRENNIFFHTDAAQAVGKVPIDVNAMNIDLLSVSGHKIYGPKGVGALYVRRKPRVRLKPLIYGGGQERGMRSGTLATPLCVGLGEACEIAQKEMKTENEKLWFLHKLLRQKLEQNLSHIYLNGHPESRIPGNVNYSFAFVEGEGLMMSVHKVALASGSACTSASLEPSYVLRALGVGSDLAHTSLRIGLGRFSTEEQVNCLVKELTISVNNLRNMSPLWEMAQEGIDLSKIQWAAH